MTQAELARDVGVTRQTVVAVEAGDYAPSVYLALAIADRLGRTVEELFGNQPEAERPGDATMWRQPGERLPGRAGRQRGRLVRQSGGCRG